MSSADFTAQLSSKFSQLGPLLVGQASLFTPKFWNKSNLHVIDETSIYTPVRDGTQFAQTVRFTQPKRATGSLSYLLEIVLSDSVSTSGTGAPVSASAGDVGPGAYVNNLGDQILANVTHRYGSHVLHEYDGEYQQLWQRLTVNEVNEEGRNALTLGGLPLSAAPGVPELQRRAALRNGVTLYVPLDRLWFSQHMDEMWMPEAYATEGEIEITLARLENIVYNAVAPGTSPFLGNGIGPPPLGVGVVPARAPTVTSIRLIAREVTLTVPEKMARLSYYETDRGMLTHFLDLEKQRRVVIPANTAGPSRIRLDNIRLDMNELFFVVRDGSRFTQDWSCDPLQAPVYDFADPHTPAPINSTLGANRIDALMDDITSFRLEANGKRLNDDQAELVARAWTRKLYHSDAQSRSPIYHHSFSAAPEDTKNVTGFQNAANLGNLELIIDHPSVAVDRIVDVWVHSHNIIQSRRGDVVKSLK